jgi:hypothetical protein
MDETIKTYLAESNTLLKSNFHLILILWFPALFTIPSGPFRSLFFSVFLSLILGPLIFGRFWELASGNEHVSYLQIFNNHWLNFFVVALIVGVFPTMAAGILDGWSAYIARTLCETAVSTLGLFIFPFVFFLRGKLSAISAGANCMLENFVYCIPLIGIMAILSVFEIVVQLLGGHYLQEGSFSFIVVMLIQGCVATYVSLLVFTAVTKLIALSSRFEKWKIEDRDTLPEAHQTNATQRVALSKPHKRSLKKLIIKSFMISVVIGSLVPFFVLFMNVPTCQIIDLDTPELRDKTAGEISKWMDENVQPPSIWDHCRYLVQDQFWGREYFKYACISFIVTFFISMAWGLLKR